MDIPRGRYVIAFDLQAIAAYNAAFRDEIDAAQYHRRYLHGERQPGRDCPACPAPRAEHDSWGCVRTGCQIGIALLPGGQRG